MLHEFLTDHRQELIDRCVRKATKRNKPEGVPPKGMAEIDHGVPLFLQQLVEALRLEETRPDEKAWQHPGSPANAEGTRAASLHGKALLDDGHTVEQVVHGYGDVCQSITELAGELKLAVRVGEFHTLNRMLDNAIADAVTSYAKHRDKRTADDAVVLHERIGTLADELRSNVNVALRAMEALSVGNIGVNGATGGLVTSSLVAIRDLIDKALPEIRLGTGMTASPKTESR